LKCLCKARISNCETTSQMSFETFSNKSFTSSRVRWDRRLSEDICFFRNWTLLRCKSRLFWKQRKVWKERKYFQRIYVDERIFEQISISKKCLVTLKASEWRLSFSMKSSSMLLIDCQTIKHKQSIIYKTKTNSINFSFKIDIAK
jgi:hypothetical protein